VAWLEREIAGDEREAMEAHVERCDECRALVIELARTSCEALDEPAREAAAPLTVGARLGRYVVLEWLGQGGMGVVYAAFDPELDRRVALKVLHPDHGDERVSTNDTLLREAQALARVSHPNVVTVYDVGAHEGRVFLSMEYVRGETLAAWLGREPRSWSVLLARFVDAARGLAAAHEAGLIHRDFKPSNVLIGVDGRVRVTDFGLACLAISDATTLPGARSWKGTPAYMSPEQRRGERVDARSDQYSFCVALDEALRSELPARGESAAPARVGAAIARGLSAKPSERFPSLDALIAALEPERATSRWPIAIALVAVCVALGLGAWARVEAAAPRPCAGADRKLAALWNDDRRRAVAAAFTATKTPFAGDALREVSSLLDAYAERWVATHELACEATRVTGEQSQDLLDLRIGCLDGEAHELGALVESFTSANAKTVELAVQAAHRLPPLEACADSAALRARVRPPSDPALRAESVRVRASLDRAIALDRGGQSAAAADAAAPLLAAARATLDRSLEAEVDLALGTIRKGLGDLRGSDAALLDAVEAAESAADDRVKVRALIQLTSNLAGDESKYDEAARTGGLAAAVLTRLPSEVALRAALDLSLSAVDDGRGRYREAFARTERALDLAERTFGPHDYLVAQALKTGATHLSYLGEDEKSLAYQQRALTIFEGALGAHHPEIAIALRNLGIAELALHRFDDALRDIGRARDIWREIHGDKHPRLPGFGAVIAETFLWANRLQEAKIEADRALALAEELQSSERDLLQIVTLQGAVDVKLGRFEDAVVACTRSLEICARLSNPVAETSTALVFLGETYLSMGRPQKAIAPLERARAMLPTEGELPITAVQAELLLGRALWEGGGDRLRGFALVSGARSAFAALPDQEKSRVEAEQWLAAHPLRSPSLPVRR
jgi:serine/threonine protein kinase